MIEGRDYRSISCKIFDRLKKKKSMLCKYDFKTFNIDKISIDCKNEIH